MNEKFELSYAILETNISPIRMFEDGNSSTVSSGHFTVGWLGYIGDEILPGYTGMISYHQQFQVPKMEVG